MERCDPARMEGRNVSESLRDYFSRRLRESNEQIKDAVKDFYSAHYGIRFVHKQLLLLQKNYKTELGAGCMVTLRVEPIPRCSLVLTGATNAGKSYFINELLEIPLDDHPIAPELYQPCTDRILLIQDDSALQRFGGQPEERAWDRGNVSLVAKVRDVPSQTTECAAVLSSFQEVARIFNDDYETLSSITNFLVDRTQHNSLQLGGSFEFAGKDMIVRASNTRNILSTGLQIVDFPGYGDSLPEIQKYVTSSMSFVKPTVCLWLLNKALFKEKYDTEYIRKLQELYQERCQTQFIVAVGKVDQEDDTIECKNMNDLKFYVDCVKGIAVSMDRAMCRQAGEGGVFGNRQPYTLRVSNEKVDLDLRGISTVRLQDVKETDQKEVTDFEWLHFHNWINLKEDIAMAIRNHTRIFVRRQRGYFDQKLREFIHHLRRCLSEVNSAHHQVERMASKLKDHVTQSRDCLKDLVEDTLKRWKPEAREIMREWDVEQENLNIKEMEYYKYNPRRQILTRLLDYNVGMKTKQLVVLTTDHTVHYATRSFFDDFKRRTFNEKYSKNVNDLFSRLQSMGYSANELPKSLEKALDILVEFYEVQRLIEEIFYSSFPNFFSHQTPLDHNSGDGEAVGIFIRSYVKFLINSCLPTVKQQLLACMTRKIDKIFEHSIRVLRSWEREAEIKGSNREEFYERVDRHLMPYCGFLNMCLSSLHWEFCERPDVSNCVLCVRRPGAQLTNYARNLVEVKMLLDSFNERKRSHFVALHCWRYDRQEKTIYVLKEGNDLKPAMSWLRTECGLSAATKLKMCYKFGLDILFGVVAIHKQNFIIDDFSPENIYLAKGCSRALIDLDTLRSGPFASLKLSESDVIPPIHVHPKRFASASCLSQVFDMYSYATILWFLIDGTGSSQNLPKVFLTPTTCQALQKVLRHETPLIPERCDITLYERMRDCWNLANTTTEEALRMLSHLKVQLKQRLNALADL